MAVTPRKVETDVEVNDRGELVVPAADLGELAVPGQRLHVTVSSPAPRVPRQSMRGVLAGKVRPITREEIKAASREAWGEWAQ
jgi:hypothetical protein